ncbi:ABC transporter substrate-binding protein [Streptosporangium sp. NPDC006013]|uniref:ABC transporter substrate-binding protein n=1 Tax=Streptosporangium sp. NPDC006013 TaxID=3155596 RepID=UPI0033B1BDE6
MKLKRILAVAAAGALAAGLTACGGSSSGSGGDGPIVIGYNGDLSGPFSISGQGGHAGIKAYFDALNASGGVNGRQIQLVSLDDQSDVQRGLGNIQQLLTQRKVHAIVGVTISSICEAATDLAVKAETVLACTAASPTQVSPPSTSPWVFQPQSGQDYQVAPVLQLIEKTVTADKPKVAFIHIDAASQQGFAKSFGSALSARSWPMVGKEVVPLTASPDIRAQASKLVAAKPDAIVSLLSDKNAALLRDNVRALGFEGPIIQNPDAGPAILEKTKDENLFVLTHTYLDNTADDRLGGDANWQAMLDAFAKAKISVDTSYTVRGYLNGLEVGSALLKCGGCSGRELRDAIEANPIPSDGITPGDLKFTTEVHQGAAAMPAYRWQDGRTVLYLDRLATGTGAN